MQVNADATHTITLNTYQAELIELALCYHEDNARDISSDLFSRPDQDAGDLDMSREFLIDADAMHAIRKQLIFLFNMGHVEL